jgi:hypothetical protein
MQPRVNFRVTDKNVEQLVVVKDTGFLPSASCRRMTRICANATPYPSGVDVKRT